MKHKKTAFIALSLFISFFYAPVSSAKLIFNPWVYNQDQTIPAGLKNYKAKVSIVIPTDIDPGDYHFMIRVTDKAGWQQLKAVSIKIKA